MSVLLALTCLGFDVRPLLALGSVSSLIVGLAAQSTLSNFVSAMALVRGLPASPVCPIWSHFCLLWWACVLLGRLG